VLLRCKTDLVFDGLCQAACHFPNRTNHGEKDAWIGFIVILCIRTNRREIVIIFTGRRRAA
jgi:hypothetical protein